MGTVIAVMAGYYVLNGQAFRALGEAAQWLHNKLPQHEQEDNERMQ